MTSGAPPTEPARRVVVVREGPPKRRGAFIDGIVGVLGVALLVMAGVLGQTLPEQEVIPTQFLPEFPTNNTVAQLLREGGTNSSDSLRYVFLDGEEARITVQIAHNNVVSINMQAYLEGDDIGSSLPDAFTFTLLDPEGNPVDTPFKANTAQPKQRTDTVPSLDPQGLDNATSPIYVSGETNPANSWRLGAPPDAEYIGGEGKKIQWAEALVLAEAKYTQPTIGEWTLVVKLTNAGDCPAASPSGQNDRYLECMRETGNTGQDPGNAITVKFVRYDYYTITLPEP